MCGITGYVGERNAVGTAIENLKRLEYRGYDSAGVAFPNCTTIQIVRAAGKIANLETALLAHQESEQCPAASPEAAIAHTRWATHGKPTERNAHPHRDCSGRIAVVHNGIIENYAALREDLKRSGHEFSSETDTEVVAHLIEEKASSGTIPFADAVRLAAAELVGSYALAVISQDTPDTVYVARRHSPLVIGLGDGENFLASDIAAVIKFTRRVILLEDGDFAVITRSGVEVTDSTGSAVYREPLEITWDDALV